MLKQLGQRLIPFEEMLTDKPFLLDERPRFVDFDLYGGALYRFAKYYPEINGIFVRQDYVKHQEINFPWHNGFLAADRKADAKGAHGREGSKKDLREDTKLLSRMNKKR